jgi:signal transduction histidine kinase
VIFVQAHDVPNDETAARMALDAKVGRYVRILIRDTCTGIPARVIDRVLDPLLRRKDREKAGL